MPQFLVARLTSFPLSFSFTGDREVCSCSWVLGFNSWQQELSGRIFKNLLNWLEKGKLPHMWFPILCPERLALWITSFPAQIYKSLRWSDKLYWDTWWQVVQLAQISWPERKHLSLAPTGVSVAHSQDSVSGNKEKPGLFALCWGNVSEIKVWFYWASLTFAALVFFWVCWLGEGTYKYFLTLTNIGKYIFRVVCLAR